MNIYCLKKYTNNNNKRVKKSNSLCTIKNCYMIFSYSVRLNAHHCHVPKWICSLVFSAMTILAKWMISANNKAEKTDLNSNLCAPTHSRSHHPHIYIYASQVKLFSLLLIHFTMSCYSVLTTLSTYWLLADTISIVWLNANAHRVKYFDFSSCHYYSAHIISGNQAKSITQSVS